jgi:hypothetical protein
VADTMRAIRRGRFCDSPVCDLRMPGMESSPSCSADALNDLCGLCPAVRVRRDSCLCVRNAVRMAWHTWIEQCRGTWRLAHGLACGRVGSRAV